MGIILILLLSTYIPIPDICVALMKEQQSIVRQYEEKVKEQQASKFLSERVIIGRQLASLTSNFYAIEQQLVRKGCQHLPT